ncbi:calcium/sodium antiporter [Edwardsiella ictaluri]|uniref:K+-dependent Na+/Ca+ exchanger-like protein n=2 Tax=Edwardsiella ictaluri TaxID=67780 RepID=C5B734_EDWI9|nr:calcium/sodium antiporter [Edwardsiella ictaluri]ACR67808.1 K+-dependent Na+/Ca+ exchanger-like protein [Edwardsiella ictaluri 93-146]AVZ81742.1 calcium/sodium antiporter [Edwardsiella ictaluri]EKS7763074.1 calcium/sodium antiporter [Edwardsiella ictaluri]EKS7770363.1 calcium/sodium antiporter [Edwardsiella ictaluri]EKS7773504.1 calcium/sodium antiporter [Edwardsiella ictaluri]
MLLATLLMLIGLLLLVYGADRVVYGAAAVAHALGVAPLVIGMTIVSMGTSLPELTVSLTATLHNQIDTAVGNVLGSNITNILLILGCAALIRPLSVRSDIVRRELPLTLGATILCGFLLYDNQLNRIDGAILMTFFGAFLWLMLKMAHRVMPGGQDSYTREQIAELPRDTGLPVALLWIALGFIILPLASRMVIDNATVLARYLGVSELIIGLTVIAVGTSLPELATACAGAIKGEHDIVLGNIIGSNTFNILVVLGIPALIGPRNPLIDDAAFARDYWVMLAFTLVLTLLCLRRRHSIGRLTGALLLCAFIAYIGLLYMQPSLMLYWD